MCISKIENQQRFCELWNTNVKRNGSVEFLNWLNTTKFFEQPASAFFHLNVEGGLCLHSLHVYDRLVNLCNSEYRFSNGEYSSPNLETITIISLAHDVCKYNVYKFDFKNRKNYDSEVIENAKRVNRYNVKSDSNGEFIWETVRTYIFDDPEPYGHGEKSVDILRNFIRLTDEEKYAIRYHMGPWGTEDSRSVNKVFNMYTLALMLNIADAQATFIDERVTK